jgi:hypothetical protein
MLRFILYNFTNKMWSPQYCILEFFCTFGHSKVEKHLIYSLCLVYFQIFEESNYLKL